MSSPHFPDDFGIIMAHNLVRILAALVAAAVLWPVPAQADTAVMAGSFGVKPDYQAMGLCPCTTIKYNTSPLAPTAAYRAIDTWAAAQDTQAAQPPPRTLVTYSLSAVGALDWIEANPEAAHQVRWVMVGSPDPVGNGNRAKKRADDKTLPPGGWSNVEFIIVQYDAVADAPADRTNWLAMLNASMSQHIRGYNDVDLGNPDAVWTDPNTGHVQKYYRTDVLPILKWRDWFTSDERMAELDAYYRPKIEAAYDRPVDLNPPAAQENTWQSAATGTQTTTPTLSSEKPTTSDQTSSLSPSQQESGSTSGSKSSAGESDSATREKTNARTLSDGTGTSGHRSATPSERTPTGSRRSTNSERGQGITRSPRRAESDSDDRPTDSTSSRKPRQPRESGDSE